MNVRCYGSVQTNAIDSSTPSVGTRVITNVAVGTLELGNNPLIWERRKSCRPPMVAFEAFLPSGRLVKRN